MDEATWRQRQADDLRRTSQKLWGRDYPLPDIPQGALGADEWMQPNDNPLNFSGYPVWDRVESVRSRANQIMVENPGVYSPEMATEIAEKEVPQYTLSEKIIVDMEQEYIRRGMDPGDARELAVMNAEDAYRQRGKAARSQTAPQRTPARKPASQLPPLESYSRNAGASLPLPADGEVQFGSKPASKPAPSEQDDMWQGWEAFEGADISLVRRVATHLVKNKKMSPNDAWQAAQVEASRRGKEGTTSTHAELDSRLAGGRSSELQTPGRRVPGPNDPTGVPTSVSREMSPEEQYQYNYRAPSGSGGYDFSNRDMDMAARGMVPIQTPDGVRYMVSAEYHPDQVGRDGVPGMRPDLEEHGYEIVDTERDITGAKRRVYKYTGRGAAKAYNEVPQGFGGFAPGSPRARRARIKAIAESGGMTYTEAEGLVSQAEAEARAARDAGKPAPAPGSHAMYDRARDQAQTNRDRDRLDRIKAARQAAMLAGGQPTSGPGGTRAFSAGLGMLPPEWQNQVLANRLSGGDIGGATPNDVQAAHNQVMTRLGLNVAQGAGFAQGGQDMAVLQYQERLRQEERMRRGRATANQARKGAADGVSAERRARAALVDSPDGYSQEEIEMILGDTSGAAPSPVMPPSGATGPAAGGADGGWTG
jgi:hypothetical protein